MLRITNVQTMLLFQPEYMLLVKKKKHGNTLHVLERKSEKWRKFENKTPQNV